MKPFRWNLTKQEQLGTLLNGDRALAYSSFFDELQDCAVKVVAAAKSYDCVFVGRSPESIYDFLTGAFESTKDEGRLTHLNISNRFKSINQIKGDMAFNFDGLKKHFAVLGLSPKGIIAHEFGVCFVDLVYSGSTYEQLFFFLEDWCKHEKEDFNALKKKVRFLGITSRTKNSPNTWRWQQHADWVKENQHVSIKNISVSRAFWSYLGDDQDKVEPANTPEKWGTDSLLLPPRGRGNLKALRLAFDVYSQGKEGRVQFFKQLSSYGSWRRGPFWLFRLLFIGQACSRGGGR